jgi:DNA-binding NarL/FixJ family response regulator
MSFDVAITHYLRLLKDSDRDAARPLWQAYRAQLVRLARDRRGKAVAGEELGDLLRDEPTPEVAIGLAAEYEFRIGYLNDETLRQLALRKMQGLSNQEIAERLGCTDKTVERKLRSIRKLWTDSGETTP